MSNLAYQINVMRAFEEGKTVEVCERAMPKRWFISPDPKWDWKTCNYRVYTSKPSIDWNHVSEEYNYLTRDYDGSVWLYKVKPILDLDTGIWVNSIENWNIPSPCLSTRGHSSTDPGTCDWKDSLITRP